MIPTYCDGVHLYVKTPYEQRDWVKDFLNGSWSKEKRMYRFPLNYRAAVELVNAFPLLKFNKEFMELGKRLHFRREAMLQMKAQEDTEGDMRLRPYQRVDVDYLSQLSAAGIFNEPRTGKTPTTILLIQRLQTMTNLIVCPASLVKNWEIEFKQWFPEIEVYAMLGSAAKKRKVKEMYLNSRSQKVIIYSRQGWKTGADERFNYNDTPFDLAAVDEAHFLRNKETSQSKAVYKINAKRRYALTGTPAVKHDSDVFWILKFLYPEMHTSFWNWAERYFEIPCQEQIIGIDSNGNFITVKDRENKDWNALTEAQLKPHRAAEFKEMLGLLTVQRKRSEVMQWLPEKDYQTLSCVMSSKQSKLYDQMLQDFFVSDETEDGEYHEVDTMNVLTQLLRLRQLCLDPRLLGFDAKSGKTEALLEWLDNNREPVVIMSMFTSYLYLIRPEIEKMRLRVGMIVGKGTINKEKREFYESMGIDVGKGMTGDQIQRAKEMFQNGELDVLLCNIISAGEGHTLDRAETIIFTDKAWNPSDNQQAEDRITPTTEERNHSHTILSLEVPNTVDSRINEILKRKQKLTEVVNNGSREEIRRLMLDE